MITYFLSFAGALLIGLILGLIGAGGSILTVPVLVYIMGVNPVIATAYSLFIVGITSSVGTVLNFRKGIVEISTAVRFAIPSVISIFLTRKFIVPALPEIIFENHDIIITKEILLMVLFSMVMLAAALSMLKKKPEPAHDQIKSPMLIIIWLFIVGIVVGMIGAGGGFLMIPALVFMAKLPMKKAVGTSLLIIAINSLTGFIGDIGTYPMDWLFLICFTTIAIIGIFTGIYFARFIPDHKLKRIFGWFVLVMAVSILTKEVFFRL